MDRIQESSDMKTHKIPGGEYTNLFYPSKNIGFKEKWSEIKRKYAEANVVLGEIPKVTPSSKVVGDLSQLMISKDMSLEDVSNRYEDLEFTESEL